VINDGKRPSLSRFLLHSARITRSGLPVKDLVTFYTTVCRPVFEYANVIWHHSITVAQSDRLEVLRKRALRIISSTVWDMPYPFALFFLDLESLHQRRINQGKNSSGQYVNPAVA